VIFEVRGRKISEMNRDIKFEVDIGKLRQKDPLKIVLFPN